MRLIALKTFLNRGRMTQEGEEFTVNEGIARDYLVNGLAKRLDSDTVEKANEPAATAETTQPLGQMKVAILREMATGRGIPNVSEMNKQELITAINATI